MLCIAMYHYNCHISISLPSVIISLSWQPSLLYQCLIDECVGCIHQAPGPNHTMLLTYIHILLLHHDEDKSPHMTKSLNIQEIVVPHGSVAKATQPKYSTRRQCDLCDIDLLSRDILCCTNIVHLDSYLCIDRLSLVWKELPQNLMFSLDLFL